MLTDVSPAGLGVASVVAALLAWAGVWLALNQGPDGIGQDRAYVAVTVGGIPLLAVVCGMLAVAKGLHRRNWPGIVAGAIGLLMIACEMWFLLANWLS